MSSVANNSPAIDEQLAVEPSLEAGSVSSVALRDNARVTIIRTLPQRSIDAQLNAPGSYFCVSFTGNPVISNGEETRPLANDKLHILRQFETSPDRIVRFGSASDTGCLAVLVLFSREWRASCPQGPACRVARFLLGGNNSSGEEDDAELELDSVGSSIARSLLDSHIDDDSDLLKVEQSFLAILSWAYGRYTLLDCSRKWNSSLQPKATNRTREAAEILRQRLDNPPTISEVSALVGMNESDLKRCFKSLYGTTIASYSRRRRLEAARDLLAHSSLGIARIALEVGFASPSQFARAFRLHYGRNPAAYRRLPSQII